MTNQSSTADSHHVLPPHSSIVNRQSSIPWSLLLLTCTLFLSCTPNREIEIEEIAHYNTSGWAHDVTLDHGFLYVSDRQGGYLVFRRDGDYTGPRIHAPVQDVISLAPHNGRPLLASRFEGLVLVSPSGRVEDRLSNGDIANAVVTRNDLAFAAYGSHGLVICSIGAQSLSLVSELPTPGWSHDVKLWRNRVLMADWNYGLRVVDISVPENPREIGILPSPATAICISVGELMGKPAAAVAEGHAGVSLVALDINGRPAFLSRHILGLNPADAPHPEAGGWAHGVALCGSYLFVANWKRGLAVLDVRDPSQPRAIMEVPTRGTSLGVKAEAAPDGTILVFLADGEEGLRVFRFKGRIQTTEVRIQK
jgi:hypothetical protein